MAMITRPVSSLYTKLRLNLRAREHRPWPIPCLAKCSHHAETISLGIPAQTRATCNEADLYLHWKWRCDSLALKSAAGALFASMATDGTERSKKKPHSTQHAGRQSPRGRHSRMSQTTEHTMEPLRMSVVSPSEMTGRGGSSVGRRCSATVQL